jgi:hypothetical protein
MMVEVGDVVRFERFQGVALRQPLWAHVYIVTEDMAKATVLVRGDASYQFSTFTFVRSGMSHDGRSMCTTVPEGKWPDEVCSALARRALLPS